MQKPTPLRPVHSGIVSRIHVMPQVHQTLSFIQEDVSPYVLVVVGLSVLLLNPTVADNVNILQATLPYIFLLSSLCWLLLTGTWYTHLAIQRRWHRIVAGTILEWAQWLWVELKQLGRFYLVKTAFGMVASLSVILGVQWIYFHFDIWRMISTVYNFFVEAWFALFKVHLLVVLVHEWTNSFAIRTLRNALELAQTVVRDYPLQGLFLIVGMGTSVVGAVYAVRYIVQAISKANASYQNGVRTQTQEANEIVSPKAGRRMLRQDA